jgi:uncharacterized protein YjiS (DUF1127 family)
LEVLIMRNLQYVNGNKTLATRFSGPVRFVYETVIDPVRRCARRRAGGRELAQLDDRLLRDIGLSRAQVLAAAFGPVGPDRRFLSRSVRAGSPGPGNVVRLERPIRGQRIDQPAATPLAKRAVRG